MLAINQTPLTLPPAPGPPQRRPDADIMSLPYIFSVLRRRLGLLIGVALAVVALVAGVTLLIRPTFAVSAKVIVNHMAPLSLGESAPIPVINDLVSSNGQQSLETYVALFQSAAVASAAVRELDFPTSVDAVERGLKITPLTNTNILQLTVTAPNADHAAAIANALVLAAITSERQLNASRANDARDVLAKALVADRRMSLEAEGRKASFQSSHRILDSETQAKTAIEQDAALNDKIRQVSADHDQALGELADLTSQVGRRGSTTAAAGTLQRNPARDELESQLSQVEVELADATKRYTDQNPAVQSLQQEKSDLQRELARVPAAVSNFQDPLRLQLDESIANVKARIAGDETNLATLAKQEQSLSEALKKLPEVIKEFNALERSGIATNSVYTALEQKYAQAVVASTIARSDVSMLDTADPAQAQRRPSLLLNVELACFLGIFLGIAAALVADGLSRYIREDNIDSQLGLPLVATLSRVDIISGRGLSPALALRHFASAVAIKKDLRAKAIAVIGCTSSDNNLSAALEVARAFSEVETRILLVNADIKRKDSLPSAPFGLMDILDGSASIAQCIKPSAIASLDTLNIGRTGNDALRSFTSTAFQVFIDEAWQSYGMLVFVAPPLMEQPEGLPVCAVCDLTLLALAKAGATVASAQRAIELLSDCGACVTGVVLTKDARSPHHELQPSFTPLSSSLVRDVQ
jgi:succinoglycan biosynthesis transport protein ExoP